MVEGVHAALAGWESFYVIVGSSAAALIGLQFVVIALIKDTRAITNEGSISAFGTPTVVHLAGALLISAVMSAPWPSLLGVAISLAATGVGGVTLAARVINQTRRQTVYAPVLEDWLWHAIFPFGVYAALTIAAFFLIAQTQDALFVIGAAALGLLFIAIHNAWDTVTYLVVSQHAGAPEAKADAPKPEQKRSKQKQHARARR